MIERLSVENLMSVISTIKFDVMGLAIWIGVLVLVAVTCYVTGWVHGRNLTDEQEFERQKTLKELKTVRKELKIARERLHRLMEAQQELEEEIKRLETK